MRICRGCVMAAIVAALAGVAASHAQAQAKYDEGANDVEIRIGNNTPYTGPAAPRLSFLGKTVAAYFKKINAEGGINGRKIKFISSDDAYDPTKTPEVIRKLVEEDKVLFIGAPFGSAPNAAVQKYLNDKKVPQLFVMSGTSRWDHPDTFPWSIGWQPSYEAEAHIYAQYLLENHRQGKIGVLYQNDEFGKSYLKGLKDALAGKMQIAAEAPYDILAEPNIDAQMTRLKASGADILFDGSVAKVPLLAVRKAAALGWKPLHILGSNAYIKPVGVEGAEGLLSAAYLKDTTDPAWVNDAGRKDYMAFLDEYMPDADKNDNLIAYAYGHAQSIEQVLKQCGDDLTRANVMRQAANLKSLQLGMVLPGILINTSASDFAPIEQMRMARFNGQRWEVFGPVRSGVDPGAVSEGFKAIFQYGTSTRETANQQNANTVTMMTGAFGETYVQIGADLATVLDDGDKFRLLPVVGRGSVQAVADILFLKGVDVGIVRTDTLDYLEKKGYANNIRKQFAYITRLYNEEMHVIAHKSITNFADLDGKTVAVDLPDGGTFVTSISVFERLGVKPHFLYIEPRIALERLRRGEIDAMIMVEGKPVQPLSQISAPDLHFVPVDYGASLQADYLPTQLTSDDYPNLIGKGESVETIAATAVLAAYNWLPTADRYRRLSHFVDALFSKVRQLQKPPFHPKWREITLQASVPGWTRFRPAQEWLDHNVAATAENGGKFQQLFDDHAGTNAAFNADADPQELEAAFHRFLVEYRQMPGRSAALGRPQGTEALFREFLEWRKSHH
jgi:branched-chain amino acid transport system substrate-binding protein